MGENRDVAGVLTKGVAPALGMAMVWPLLRYASFFMLLYPVGLEVPLGARGLTAHGAFLATLAVAAVMALALWCGANGVFRRRRLAAALGTLASVGALLAFGVKGAVLPPWALWVSIAATAVGFLALYLAWGSYMAGLMAGGEYPRAVALLGLSFALSFVLFSRAGLVGSLAGGRAAAVAMPLGAAALWLCSRPAVPLVVDGERFVPCRAVTPLFTAVGMFLVVGSAVRGIVDLQSHGTPGRQFSMEASLLVAAVSVAVAARCRRGRSAERVVRAESDVVALLAVVFWMAFALLFLGGLFVFLATDLKQVGGDVVVVSRTLMEVVFWLLLCHTVAVRRVPAVPLFLVCGVSVEVVSWTVSYALIPALASTAATSAMLGDNSFVLAVVLGAVAVALVGMGARWAFGRSGMGEVGALPVLGGTAGPAPVPGGARVAGGAVAGAATVAGVPLAAPPAPAGEGLLTEREAAVARLYARGYSLQKVADELHITRSTAQSHIKHVYRKLGVHSRDELIELLDGSAGRG